LSFLDLRFRGEPLATLARALVERVNLHDVRCVPFSLQVWWLLLKAGDVVITPPARMFR
jgi:hypothetical protein